MAIILGRRQPPSAVIAMLHLADCELPCWIGIVPGKTTIAEARARIRKLYEYTQIDGADGGVMIRNPSDGSYAIAVGWGDGEDSDAVSFIGFIFPTESFRPTFGELYYFVGTPVISATEGYALYTVRHIKIGMTYIRTEMASLEGDCWSMTPEKPIHSLFAYPDLNHLRRNLPTQPWRGFGTCHYIP